MYALSNESGKALMPASNVQPRAWVLNLGSVVFGHDWMELHPNELHRDLGGQICLRASDPELEHHLIVIGPVAGVTACSFHGRNLSANPHGLLHCLLCRPGSAWRRRR